jgi:hypothetical protein
VLVFVILVGIAIAVVAWWGQDIRPDYMNGAPAGGSVSNGAGANGNADNGGSANNGENGHNMTTPGAPDSRLRTYGI